jgi:hypothetical protein
MDQAAVAAPAERDRNARAAGIAKAVLSAPLTITIVGAILGSQLIPAWTNHLQDHKQRLEVRSQVATDMTDAFTNALAITSSSGSGYTDGVGTWLAQSGKARAELTARYGGDAGVTTGWHSYAALVSRYLKNPGNQAQRDALLAAGSALVREAVLLSPRV